MVLVFSLALRHGFRQMSLPLMSRRTRIWVDKTLPGKQFDFLKVNAFKKMQWQWQHNTCVRCDNFMACIRLERVRRRFATMVKT
jgi:hypothetical protein